MTQPSQEAPTNRRGESRRRGRWRGRGNRKEGGWVDGEVEM